VARCRSSLGASQPQPTAARDRPHDRRFWIGALLLLSIPLKALQITIPVAMIGVAVFSLLNQNLGPASQDCEHVA
jgi:hypothetical protein